MLQQISDNFWQAEARSEETKQLIQDIKRLTRRKFIAEEKVRIVLKAFAGTRPSGTSAAGKASILPRTMPG